MLDVESIMTANGLSFGCHPVAENPFMPQDSRDLSHWFCTISGGPVEGFEFYVSVGEDVTDDQPSAALALSLVLEDVRSFRSCEGYSDFVRMIGLDETDPAGAVAWEELGRLAPLVEALVELGEKSTLNPI